MQDKNMVINELKKLILVTKGKYVETQFDKPFVVRQPNAQRIPQNKQFLGNALFFQILAEMRSFKKRNIVIKTNVSDGLFKQVTQQNLPHNRKQAEIHSNVLKPGIYLNDLNARTKKPNVVPISARKPKRKANKSVATPHKKIVASDTTIQKSKSYHEELYENTNQEWKWWIAKRCPSGYTWTQKPLRTKKIWMPKIRKENEINKQSSEFLNKNSNGLFQRKKALNIRLLLLLEHSEQTFDEDKEMMSDHNISDLATTTTREVLVEMSLQASFLKTKASDMTTLTPLPTRDKIVCSLQSKKDRVVTTRVRISLQSFT
ncbi:hypothetical protein Tco_0000732 [Tanacetum coccineum]